MYIFQKTQFKKELWLTELFRSVQSVEKELSKCWETATVGHSNRYLEKIICRERSNVERHGLNLWKNNWTQIWWSYRPTNVIFIKKILQKRQKMPIFRLVPLAWKCSLVTSQSEYPFFRRWAKPEPRTTQDGWDIAVRGFILGGL